jgi:antitoxin (DNA-binding transcriptional repressor) of toxin-antitoxin stability system
MGAMEARVASGPTIASVHAVATGTMKTLNAHEAKTRLSAVLADIESKGEVYLICRSGKPIAELSPHRTTNRLSPHPVPRRIKIAYDPVEPLDEGDWPG